MDSNQLMRIGDLAERTDNTPQTIRYYEQLGLIVPTEREGRGYRYYNEDAVTRLQKIATLKQIGLSLEEISAVIDLYFTDSTGIQGKRKVLDILRRHRQETDERMISLQSFRSELDQNIARVEGLIRAIERGDSESAHS